MIVSFAYQYLATDMPVGMTEGAMAIMPLVIVLVGVGLLYYAWSMHKKDVLR